MTKAEVQAAARKVRDAAEATIKSRLSFIDRKRSDFEAYIGRYEVLVCVALDEGAEAVASLGKDWREWARKQVPGQSAPTLYRWRNAGKVARVLMGDGSDETPNLLGEVPAALVGSLVPLYRILTEAKTDEDRETAEGIIRDAYSELLAESADVTIPDENGSPITVKAAPLADAVLAKAEAISPAKKGKKAAAKKAADKSDESPEDSDDSRRESNGLVQVDAAAVEAASGPVSSILAQCVRESGLDEAKVKGIFLAALRLAGEHGITTVQAVLGSPVAAPVAAAPADEKAAA